MYQESVIVQKYRTRTSVGSSWKPWITNQYKSYVDMFSIDHYPINYDADDGGPWILHRVKDVPVMATFVGTSPNNLLVDGDATVALKPNSWSWSQTATGQKSDKDMDAYGTTAMARTAPTNPAFDLSTSLGELVTEGIPTSMGSSYLMGNPRSDRNVSFFLGKTEDTKKKVALARSAGSEYLKAEFGWLPLMRDIQDFATTVKESHQILDQYRKDSGMKIRRGYDSPPVQSTFYRTGSMQGVPAADFSGPGGVTETYFRRQWFRGAFRYHIPASDETYSKFAYWASMSDHLLGWKVTPETVWNIAPWSWAADWFTNTGDVLANISNLGRDGLVMQYGYSMAQSSKEVRTYARFSKRYGQVFDVSRYFLEEWKQRRPATPYGFGIDLKTLTGKQIAIMSALGLSRL